MKFLKIPFANNGDRSNIPDVDPLGTVNWNNGYGPDYSLDPEKDPTAKRINRDTFNELFYVITSILSEIQQLGLPTFITPADNDGKPLKYQVGAVVSYDGKVYKNLVKDNIVVPGKDDSWSVIPTLNDVYTKEEVGDNFVSILRKVNGKQLDKDINVTSQDILGSNINPIPGGSINTLLQGGIYYTKLGMSQVTTANGYPSNGWDGVLFVCSNNYMVSQEYISSNYGARWLRIFIEGKWSEWARSYDSNYKPSAGDVNAYSKIESDQRYVPKTTKINGVAMSTAEVEVTSHTVFDKGTELEQLSILSNFRTPGIYVQKDATSTSVGRGFPFDGAKGVCVVYNTRTGTANAVQVWYDVNGQVWSRVYNFPIWTDWVRSFTTAEAEALTTQKIWKNVNTGDPGPLNSLYAPGIYVVPNTGWITTAKNYPEAGGSGFIVVYPYNQTFGLKQEFHNYNGKVWFRWRENGNWLSWQRYYSSADKPPVDDITGAVADVRLGTKVTYYERGGTERVPGGVMTSWQDRGKSDYWLVWRPLQILVNGTWKTVEYI